MIILGVDPGTNYTGFGIINADKNTFTRVVNGIIKLPANKYLTEKLEIIYDELNKLIKKYNFDFDKKIDISTHSCCLT